MQRRVRPSRGYVLVMALVLLALAATLMTGIARAAITHASEARQAQDELQRRWGSASCRNVALPYAEKILAGLEIRRRRPVPVHRTSIRLGNQIFDLILSDEQAK